MVDGHITNRHISRVPCIFHHTVTKEVIHPSTLALTKQKTELTPCVPYSMLIHSIQMTSPYE